MGTTDLNAMSGVEDFDAIVIGANYGGLITAAILARNGMRVVVIDEADQIGGQGATFRDGYWLDWGARGAKDFGDPLMLASRSGGLRAAEIAGVDIDFIPLNPVQMVHLLPEGRAFPGIASGPGSEGYIVDVLGVPPELMAGFGAAIKRLARQDPEEWMGVTFAQWLPTIDESLRAAFTRLATMMLALPEEATSVGRFISFLQTDVHAYRCDDAEVGGMQGFMEPYARAVRARGGQIRLGVKTSQIVVSDNAVRGVVALDHNCGVQALRSPVVVFAEPAWDIIGLVDDGVLPDDLVRDVRALQGDNGDIMSINVGLSRLPTIAETGKSEDFIGWHRILHGPDRVYGAGWMISTLTSRRQAPDGKHLMYMGWGTCGPSATENPPFTSLSDAQAKAETILDGARSYYRDLDDIIEWKSYNLQTGPTSLPFQWKTYRRAPVRAPGVDGLFLVSGTTEAPGIVQDIAAHAALQAADLVLG